MLKEDRKMQSWQWTVLDYECDVDFEMEAVAKVE